MALSVERVRTKREGMLLYTERVEGEVVFASAKRARMRELPSGVRSGEWVFA